MLLGWFGDTQFGTFCKMYKYCATLCLKAVIKIFTKSRVVQQFATIIFWRNKFMKESLVHNFAKMMIWYNNSYFSWYGTTFCKEDYLVHNLAKEDYLAQQSSKGVIWCNNLPTRRSGTTICMKDDLVHNLAKQADSVQQIKNREAVKNFFPP